MTTQTRTLLEQVCKCTWLDPDRDRQTILQILQQYPISGDEIREIQMAMIQYHDDPDITENITLCFGPILQQARPTMTTSAVPMDTNEKIAGLAKGPPLRVQHVHRCPTKFRYVVHLFSGVRRPGDFHSSVMALQDDSGLTLFPISVDIILSKEHGDLLSPTTQAFWVRLAMGGAIHYVLGGPPCETWSISRWRFFDEGVGRKPLRSGLDRMCEISGYLYHPAANPTSQPICCLEAWAYNVVQPGHRGMELKAIMQITIINHFEFI